MNQLKDSPTETEKRVLNMPPIDAISTDHSSCRMLARRFTVDDAIRRGVVVIAEDGREVTFFDCNYSFVVMKVKNQRASTVVKGPFIATPEL